MPLPESITMFFLLSPFLYGLSTRVRHRSSVWVKASRSALRMQLIISKEFVGMKQKTFKTVVAPMTGVNKADGDEEASWSRCCSNPTTLLTLTQSCMGGLLFHLWKHSPVSVVRSHLLHLKRIFSSVEKISACFKVSMLLHSPKLLDSSEGKSTGYPNPRLLHNCSHVWSNTWSTKTYGSCIKYMESTWIMKTLKRSSV